MGSYLTEVQRRGSNSLFLISSLEREHDDSSNFELNTERRDRDEEESGQEEGLNSSQPESLLSLIQIELVDADLAVQILGSHGVMGVLIFTRMKSAKILETPRADTFLKSLLAKFFHNLNENTLESSRCLQKMIDCLPGLQEMQESLPALKNKRKEIIMVKIAIELYGQYLMKFDGPLYERYQFEFLPFVAKFYSSLTEEMIRRINMEIKFVINCKELNQLLVMKKLPEEYEQYYKAQALQFMNLTGGSLLADYYSDYS